MLDESDNLSSSSSRGKTVIHDCSGLFFFCPVRLGYDDDDDDDQQQQQQSVVEKLMRKEEQKEMFH